MITFINPGVQPPIYLDTANQRVGINTNSPQALFEIRGNNTSGEELIRISRHTDTYIKLLASGGSGVAFPIQVFGSSSTRTFMGVYPGVLGSLNVGDVMLGQSTSLPCFVYDNSADSLILKSTGDTTVAAATALLELKTTTKGFLPPRMTTTEKGNISSPATGLVVYDSTLNKLCVYTGAAWETVTSV